MTYAVEMRIKGRWVPVDVTRVDNKEVLITGGVIRSARLREGWDEDVDNPEAFTRELKAVGGRVDLFTFAQRLPDSRPRFNYYMEWDNVAALPVTDYDYWLMKQIHVNARNKIRKAEKQGLVVKAVEFGEELIRAIMEINNESEYRQGHRYSHYGIDYETTRRIYSTFVERSFFAVAYFGTEPIGFIKLVRTDRYIRTMGILCKQAHKERSPTNLLVAKAVGICAEQSAPFLVYGKFTYGNVGSHTLRDFKQYQGFESTMVPRYYVPLSPQGRAFISLRLHRGVRGLLPRSIIRTLLALRGCYYLQREARLRSTQMGATRSTVGNPDAAEVNAAQANRVQAGAVKVEKQ
jgi:hypothetical protein